MKNVLFAVVALFAFSLPALGQHDLEFSGGYQHISGDGGLDGFTVGTAWSFIPEFQLYLNYDGLFDHSTLGSFALTTTGLTFANSHLEELLTGPRFFLPGLFKGHGRVKGHRLVPFIDAGFGEARLHTELTLVNVGVVKAEDTAFAWALGGGADYRVYPHFAIRGDVGLLRTHFAESGQSRIRLGFTLVWSLGSRSE